MSTDQNSWHLTRNHKILTRTSVYLTRNDSAVVKGRCTRLDKVLCDMITSQKYRAPIRNSATKGYAITFLRAQGVGI